MASPNFNELTANELAVQLRNGTISSVDLVLACLDRIHKRDDIINAWVELNETYVIAEANRADQEITAGRIRGPLHGIPVGVKDIIDTIDFSTQMGSRLFSGRRPAEDARCVSLLKESGAIIMGKTVTTEFALTGAGKTANPNNILHTPGGSSSGSAAAVADFMVPLSLGSQTGGSMIRPASYCGVYGFKPTFGTVSRRGVFILARCLDHLGVYARSLDDLDLIANSIKVYDCRDLDMVVTNQDDKMDDAVIKKNTQAPHFAFVKGPAWSFVAPYVEELFQTYVYKLGSQVSFVDLSGIFDEALEAHKIIMDSNLWYNFSGFSKENEKLLMPETLDRIDRGKEITASEYIEAYELIDSLKIALSKLFQKYDAIITASASGEAPKGLSSTGDSALQKIWTVTGLPTVSLPHLSGPSGLPVGVQVIGKKGNDRNLLKTARWLEKFVGKKNGNN